jgi:hypothetical protein
MIIPGQFGFNCPSGFREEAFWNIFPIGSNVKQWSFIYSLGSVSSLVSEKKIFEISANQSILLALAAMLNIRLERKTETL